MRTPLRRLLPLEEDDPAPDRMPEHLRARDAQISSEPVDVVVQSTRHADPNRLREPPLAVLHPTSRVALRTGRRHSVAYPADAVRIRVPLSAQPPLLLVNLQLARQ